jgi:hypothetical protein
VAASVVKRLFVMKTQRSAWVLAAQVISSQFKTGT